MLKYQGSLSSFDLFLELEAFSEGRSTHAWRCFGAHPAEDEAGKEGYLFRVWAPNAPKVTIIGDFNGWQDWYLNRTGDGGRHLGGVCPRAAPL